MAEKHKKMLRKCKKCGSIENWTTKEVTKHSQECKGK